MALAGAALAASVAAGSLTTAAAGPTEEAGAKDADPAVVVPAIRWGDRDVILAQLQSEYLLEIAQSWYPSAESTRTVPSTDRDAILAQLQSEYLLEIAQSWYVTDVDPTAAADAE